MARGELAATIVLFRWSVVPHVRNSLYLRRVVLCFAQVRPGHNRRLRARPVHGSRLRRRARIEGKVQQMRSLQRRQVELQARAR